MYAAVRTYTGAGAKEFFDLLEKRKNEVEAVMRSVPGLVSYTLVRTGEGGTAVTVCEGCTTNTSETEFSVHTPPQSTFVGF